ncbi:MAG TPA: hypothetical protein VJZ49_04090 [Syntrophales bacterium]|nr:hypothetical protein [Syntrophales bacterium]
MDEYRDIASYIRQIYQLLDGYFGNLYWWPADTPFEVVVGAILTQNTAWRNVVTAISKLKDANILAPEGLYRVELSTLATLIRSSGYYRVKAVRLKAFVDFLHKEHGGSLDALFAGGVWQIREKLLQINGIGEETADSILLYAGRKPVFVVDAYTKRILIRHGIVNENAGYRNIQRLFMASLPQSVPLYNQYHALLVNTAKHFCTKKSLCGECPLRGLAASALL